MNKNEQLDKWCSARHGRAYQLAKYLGVSRQYISELKKLKGGISDKKWAEITAAMQHVENNQ